MIIDRNPIEANANTGAIQLPGNPSTPTWKSIENPLAYISSNIVGFANILENCLNKLVCFMVGVNQWPI